MLYNTYGGAKNSGALICALSEVYFYSEKMGCGSAIQANA